MMSYDGLLSLSQLTDEKLSLIQAVATTAATTSTMIGTSNTTITQNTASFGSISIPRPVSSTPVVDVTVEEEEQAAPIQTVQLPLNVAESSNITQAGVTLSAATAEAIKPFTAAESLTNTETQQRKISASSRFINAFQQFYTSATNTNTPNEPDLTDLGTNSAADMPANRTPKGMESKLLSMWHNVKYGWSGKLKPNFSKEQPVWLLGRCYHRKYTPPSSMESSTELSTNDGVLGAIESCSTYESANTISASNIYPPLNPQQVDEIVVPQELGMDAVENQVAEHPWEEGIEGFRRDFYSRIWMTYRREFPTMNGTNYTSDCGWGCMLRSGQMLLAQGLVCHFLGRSWSYDADTQLHSTYEDNVHKKIIKWFGDSSSKSSPFSIHALVSLGEEMGKKPGDWYGPASVSYLLKQALKTAAQENADFDNITIYVAKDCTKLTKLLGSHQITTSAYHPQGNGMDERFHRQLKTTIIAREDTNNWYDELPVILLGLRSIYKEEISATPAEMVFGQNLRLPGELVVPSAKNLSSTERTRDLTKNLHDSIMENLKISAEILEISNNILYIVTSLGKFRLFATY
ncbi:uncharacterized protein Atg4b isoform X2 [Eurosta solidaginis]|uniref:uncharacterized protein Atg4b isoform X2 n=1 Tax=Eurosta solidaginis TaxID=178769 RepID=UPI0035309CB0